MSQAVVRPKRLVDLFEKDLPAYPCWISSDILPKGGLLLAGGFAKIGKTFIALEYARALATGANLFGCRDFRVDRPARVLYIEQELGERGFQKRIKPVFAQENRDLLEDNLFYVSKEPQMKFDSMEGRLLILKAIEEVEPNVVIIDPMGKMHAGDENDAQHVEKLMNFTETIRKRFTSAGLAMVILHHFGKPPMAQRDKEVFDPLNQYNFRGSSKWFDAPDTIQTIQRLTNIPGKEWQAWDLKTRFITRHGEEPPDLFLSVNRDADLRVRFEKYAGAVPKLEAIGKLGSKTKEQKEAEQMELA